MPTTLTPKAIDLRLTLEEFYKLRTILSGGDLPEVHAKMQAIADRLPRRSLAPEGECAYCDATRKAGDEMFPSHDASHRCESGKRAHCTCDTCF